MREALSKPAKLHCDECDEQPTGSAAGWVAYRVDLPDDPDEPEVIVFCPSCAAREFGSPPTSSISVE